MKDASDLRKEGVKNPGRKKGAAVYFLQRASFQKAPERKVKVKEAGRGKKIIVSKED